MGWRSVVSIFPVAGIVFLQGCVTGKQLKATSAVNPVAAAPESDESSALRYIHTHTVKKWRVYAVAKEPNNHNSTDVSWCSAIYSGPNDTWFMADINTDFKMSLNFASPKWSVQENQKYQFSYAFDEDPQVRVEGESFDIDGVYFIAGSSSQKLFEKLMTSHNVTISVNDSDVVFRLTYSDDAMSEMYKCIQFYTGERKVNFERIIPAAQLATNSPWPLQKKSKTDKYANSSYWENRLDWFADEMLDYAQLTDVYRISVKSFPVALDSLQAAWRNQTVFGAVTYGIGFINRDAGATHASEFDNLCEGKSTSISERRTLPNNGAVYRAITKCDGAKTKTFVVTQYPLPDTNAHYTLFHFSEHLGRAEAMDEIIYASIADDIASRMEADLK